MPRPTQVPGVEAQALEGGDKWDGPEGSWDAAAVNGHAEQSPLCRAGPCRWGRPARQPLRVGGLPGDRGSRRKGVASTGDQSTPSTQSPSVGPACVTEALSQSPCRRGRDRRKGLWEGGRFPGKTGATHPGFPPPGRPTLHPDKEPPYGQPEWPGTDTQGPAAVTTAGTTGVQGDESTLTSPRPGRASGAQQPPSRQAPQAAPRRLPGARPDSAGGWAGQGEFLVKPRPAHSSLQGGEAPPSLQAGRGGFSRTGKAAILVSF